VSDFTYEIAVFYLLKFMIMEKIEQISLEKEINNECPLVLKKFKNDILLLLEDYIYMPFFY
jgi:hypothetical protein